MTSPMDPTVAQSTKCKILSKNTFLLFGDLSKFGQKSAKCFYIYD